MIERLIRKAQATFERNDLLRKLPEVESEAMLVSKRIVSNMSADVVGRQRHFVLAVLPSPKELADYPAHHSYWRRWQHRVEHLCPPIASCIDLGELRYAETSFDQAYDGSHHGPQTAKQIANVIHSTLAMLAGAARGEP